MNKHMIPLDEILKEVTGMTDEELEKDYRCLASVGKLPVNESCGGCIGCLEAQIVYYQGKHEVDDD